LNISSKSKDIIAAKDKRIRELEEENEKLGEQLEILRGKLYENEEVSIWMFHILLKELMIFLM